MSKIEFITYCYFKIKSKIRSLLHIYDKHNYYNENKMYVRLCEQATSSILTIKRQFLLENQKGEEHTISWKLFRTQARKVILILTRVVGYKYRDTDSDIDILDFLTVDEKVEDC